MRAREDGAAIVEFAVVFPLVALLLGAVIMFGLALSTQLIMQQGAREAVRVYALGGGDPQAAAAALVGGTANIATSGCPNPIDPDGDGIPGVASSSAAPQATVTITRDFTMGVPFLPIDSIPLSAKAVMRCGG